MTTNTVLFIGGDHDGKRMDWPEPPTEIHLPVKTASSLNITRDSAPFARQRYLRREVIDSDNSVMHVYVSNVATPLRHLIDGYQSNQLTPELVKHMQAIVSAMKEASDTQHVPWKLRAEIMQAEFFMRENNLTAG